VSPHKPLLALAGWALAALSLAPALAAEQVQQLSVNGGALVRGGAPLPEFHLDFLLDGPGRQPLTRPGGTDNLEIALTSPSSGVFRFMFSPRPQFGFSFDRASGSNRGYAGLTWNVFDSSTVFGNLGLAGTYDPAAGALAEPARRFAGQPLMLHGAVELGYHLGDQHSLSLRVDEGRAPELKAGETDNLRLRYGLKF
jgi:hypothetical protein